MFARETRAGVESEFGQVGDGKWAKVKSRKWKAEGMKDGKTEQDYNVCNSGETEAEEGGLMTGLVSCSSQPIKYPICVGKFEIYFVSGECKDTHFAPGREAVPLKSTHTDTQAYSHVMTAIFWQKEKSVCTWRMLSQCHYCYGRCILCVMESQ